MRFTPQLLSLLFLALLSWSACGDDEVDASAAELEGDWKAESLDLDFFTTTSGGGIDQEITGDFSLSDDTDLTITFETSPNITYSSGALGLQGTVTDQSGNNYDINNFASQIVTPFSSRSEYSVNGNTITFDNNGERFDVTITSLTDSELILEYDITQETNAGGFNSSFRNNGVYTLTR